MGLRSTRSTSGRDQGWPWRMRPDLSSHPLGEPAGPVQVAGHGAGAAVLEVEVEDVPDQRPLDLVRHQLLLDQVVAERAEAAGPAALPASARMILSRVRSAIIALELRETS